jgi:[ribosomal protein S18]-alanine N-acetyltransferase
MTRRFEWVPLSADVLPLVAEVEKTAYSHPWTLGHFKDTMNAGHHTQVLLGEARPGDAGLPTLADGRVLIGYLVAMQILDEVHLLNITVTPALQRQGWGRVLLDGLALWARSQQAQWLWLEVRASNHAALAAYRQRGFAEVGRRRDYYPLDNRQREDAIVMSLNLKVSA